MEVIKTSSGIGLRIKKRREELGMTQSELGKKLGLTSRAIISKIECGERDISQSKILAYAKYLETTPEYLMGYTDNPEVQRLEDKLGDEFIETVKDFDKSRMALLLAYAKLLQKS